MTRYAIVQYGLVAAVFESDQPASAFPDIEPLLRAVGPEVQCGWVDVDGVLMTRAPVPLAEAKAAALIAIDEAAETARLRYVTPGAFQAATYLRKEEQARAYKAAGYSGPVGALVQAAATARSITAAQVADLIIATADAWEVLAAMIEEARESGKVNAQAAADEAGVVAARDSALELLAGL